MASKSADCSKRRRGTLFLDEIGDINGKMRAQLCGCFGGGIRRVGGSEPIRVDVRVVAATNRDLEEEVQRADSAKTQYFRINVVTDPACRRCVSDRRTFRCWSITSSANTPSARTARVGRHRRRDGTLAPP